MKAAYVKRGATVAAALMASLIGWEVGGDYINKPAPVIENRIDSQWCAGITGIPTKAFYTDQECDQLTAGHLYSDLSALERCMDLESYPERIQFSARHLAWNTGPRLVCNSSMARQWRAGEFGPGSCAVILKYTFVAGQDCRHTGRRCPGVVKRRDYEWGVCTGAIDWRLQRWDYISAH